MDTMTPRERLVAAMSNRQPDRVAVSPGMDNMIPARLTGKPFWELYCFAEPPIWQAAIDAMARFGIDGWFYQGDMGFQYPPGHHEAIEDLAKTPDKWVVRYRGRYGDRRYTRETTFPVGDPTWETEKLVKDIGTDWELLRGCLAAPVGFDPSVLREQRALVGEQGIFGSAVSYPGLHSCGKERALVQMRAEETDLDCINPLEPPPMGDCDLAEIKRLYGHKLASMSNLHTSEVMLLGTPTDVERAVRTAIEAAGAGGGFILSTGDQMGRDTPEENIRMFVEAGRRYGSRD
jgi:hypothetical protein